MLRPKSLPREPHHIWVDAAHRAVLQRELVIVSTISSRSEQGRPGGGVENPDRSPWVLLLIVPVVIPLITAIYNSVEPKLFGMPAFYWMQLAFVPLSALCTAVVYFKTRKR